MHTIVLLTDSIAIPMPLLTSLTTLFPNVRIEVITTGPAARSGRQDRKPLPATPACNRYNAFDTIKRAS